MRGDYSHVSTRKTPTKRLPSAGRFVLTLTAIFLLLGVLAPGAQAAADASEGEKLFALHIKPLFAEKCNACHGDEPDKLRGDFDMRSREAMLRGGEYFGEEVLMPGKGGESYLYLVTTRKEEDFEMPPKAADQLSEEEQWWIRDWIDEGAPWLDDGRVADLQNEYAEGEQVPTSKALSEDWQNRRYRPEDLWAYRPLTRPDVPESGESDPAKDSPHPVDAFLAAAMEKTGVDPAPEAEAPLLIRRATFDLTGLPPTPSQVDDFLASWSVDPEQAWKDLVERLLASPQYGEQWGRHWLDVVRYADSSGFANDYERPNAWRYRDYVIRAFNEDKPYDAFVREQIAGDEIGNREDPEKLIATGFLRMGAWEHTGMSVAKETRQLFLDDVTDSVGQVFLAHALQCASCHDHKFDPVPTRDYYAMQAIFATTQFAEVDAPWLPEENLGGMEEDRAYLEQRRASNEEVVRELDRINREYIAAWFRERGLPYKTREQAKEAGVPEAKMPPGGRLFETAEEFGKERIARKWKTRFDWEMDRYEPVAFAVYNGVTIPRRGVQARLRVPGDPMKGGELETTAILGGGDPFSPTEPVEPGVLSAVPGGLDYRVPTTPEGRRTALADWIASPDNPLTARVMTNRIWQHHFGQAIAGNPNNFGATGKKPTHPELLDWLASEFIARGWSVKAMHRLLMSSQAYRRSSRHPAPETLAKKDPAGSSYAVFRPRRLAAEELRDASLLVSGELNTEAGGIPIRPDMNLEAALQPRMIMGTFAPAYVPSAKPEQRNRRTVYAQKTRGHRDPFLETFNQPSPDLSCEARDASNITPQVFALFNSEESMDRALAFSARVLAETAGQPDAAAVERAFLLAFDRRPDDDERDATLDHWRSMEKRQTGIEFAPRKFPTEITREANEENTGQIFRFTERLSLYDDYIPDLQPHEVDARTRAFADVCLVLLNANEFAYVY